MTAAGVAVATLLVALAFDLSGGQIVALVLALFVLVAPLLMIAARFGVLADDQVVKVIQQQQLLGLFQ